MIFIEREIESVRTIISGEKMTSDAAWPRRSPRGDALAFKGFREKNGPKKSGKKIRWASVPLALPFLKSYR